MVNYLPSLLHLMSLKRCQAEKAYLVSLGLGEVYSLGYRGGEKKKVVVLCRPILSFIPMQDQEQQQKTNGEKLLNNQQWIQNSCRKYLIQKSVLGRF